MNMEYSDDLNLPVCDKPLINTSLVPFDWSDWMDEMEDMRKLWLASIENHIRDEFAKPSCERFVIYDE